MKIRNGFVSNSSSSSFCIFAAEEGGKTLPAIKARIEAADGEHDLGFDEIAEQVCENLPLLEYHRDSGDSILIGRSWSSVNDDETGRQFKDSVIDALTAASGLPREQVEADCGTYEDVWYNG
jgi:hypothetical protein